MEKENKRHPMTPFLKPFATRAEKGGGKRMVEVAGYIPKNVQIQMLQASGRALEEYRHKLFPELEEKTKNEDPVFDPTIQKGYDFFDFADDIRFAQNNLRRSEQVAAERAETERLLKERLDLEAREKEQKEPAPPNGAGGI